LPPDEPDTLIGQRLDDFVSLLWIKNTESDLAGYRLYRDTYSGFVPDGQNILAEVDIEDTTYVDTITALENDLFYVLTAVDTAGMESSPSNEVAVLQVGILTEEETTFDTPRITRIVGAYPNPFNTSTNIEYDIANIGDHLTHVRIIIYDVLGRTVRTVIDEKQYPGRHEAFWDGQDQSGNPVPSGVYFARLNLRGCQFASSTKLVLQK